MISISSLQIKCHNSYPTSYPSVHLSFPPTLSIPIHTSFNPERKDGGKWIIAIDQHTHIHTHTHTVPLRYHTVSLIPSPVPKHFVLSHIHP